VKITGRRWFGAAVDTTKTRCSDKKNDLTLRFAVLGVFCRTTGKLHTATESYRVAGRGQTDKQTNKQTDRQTRVSH
jgi:hypothetical protein